MTLEMETTRKGEMVAACPFFTGHQFVQGQQQHPANGLSWSSILPGNSLTSTFPYHMFCLFSPQAREPSDSWFQGPNMETPACHWAVSQELRTCGTDTALQNSLELLIHRFTIHLWRILPFKTWAPVRLC